MPVLLGSTLKLLRILLGLNLGRLPVSMDSNPGLMFQGLTGLDPISNLLMLILLVSNLDLVPVLLDLNLERVPVLVDLNLDLPVLLDLNLERVPVLVDLNLDLVPVLLDSNLGLISPELVGLRELQD